MGDLAASHQITDLATKRTEIKEDGCEKKPTSGLVGSKRKTVNKALPHCRRHVIAENNERPLRFYLSFEVC